MEPSGASNDYLNEILFQVVVRIGARVRERVVEQQLLLQSMLAEKEIALAKSAAALTRRAQAAARAGDLEEVLRCFNQASNKLDLLNESIQYKQEPQEDVVELLDTLLHMQLALAAVILARPAGDKANKS